MEPKCPCSSTYSFLSIAFYANVIFNTPVSADIEWGVFRQKEQETSEMPMHMKWHEDTTFEP